jgi:site-specific recombinase XerD
LDLTGKGDKRRHIPLDDQSMKIIQRRIEMIKNRDDLVTILRQGSTRADLTPNLKRASEGFLFPEIMNRRVISRMFTRTADALNLPDELTFHSTRHTFATKYLENGGDIETLREILGHSSIKVTEIYAKITAKKITQDINSRTIDLSKMN